MTFSIDNPRGVATTPLRKICLGKTLRRTRVKILNSANHVIRYKRKNYILTYFCLL